MKRVSLPLNLRFEADEESCVVNVSLRSGRVIRDVLCWRGSYLEGIVVGGRDGIRESDFDFQPEDIQTLRRQTTMDTVPIIRSIKDRLSLL